MPRADNAIEGVNAFVHSLETPRVLFGTGSRLSAGAEVDRLGRHRVLLIADSIARQAADRLAGELGERLVLRHDGAAQHVPSDVVEPLLAQVACSNADVAVTIGGGSATGLGKAVALSAGLPIVAVPTTYAGSEMTAIWGLTTGARKTTGRDPRVMPVTAIYDPELTVSLPPDLSASSGLNAIAHSMEALYAHDASPVVQLIAEESVRVLAAALPRVVQAPSDLAARSGAFYGAMLAGMALGNSSMGIHHKLAHCLGGAFGLPHAPLHAALLPYSAAFNQAAAADAMAALSRALGAEDPPDALWELARRMGVPTSLRDLGVSPEQLRGLAGQLCSLPMKNPRPLDPEGLRELLSAALTGRRPSSAVTDRSHPQVR